MKSQVGRKKRVVHGHQANGSTGLMGLQAVKAPDSDQSSMEAIVIDIIIITMFYLFYFPTGKGAIFHKNNGNENSVSITTQLYSFTHPSSFSAAGFHCLRKSRCEHKHNITNYTPCSLWRRQKRKSIKDGAY